MADDERGGGRLTFVAFLLFGCAFLSGATSQAGGSMPVTGFVGFGIVVAAGAIIGAMVGLYNMGRKRGR